MNKVKNKNWSVWFIMGVWSKTFSRVKYPPFRGGIQGIWQGA